LYQLGGVFRFGRNQISGGRDIRKCPPTVQEESSARRHYQGSEETFLLLETGRTEEGQAGFGPEAEPEEESPGFRMIEALEERCRPTAE
jgi:hypothetical protein